MPCWNRPNCNLYTAEAAPHPCTRRSPQRRATAALGFENPNSYGKNLMRPIADCGTLLIISGLAQICSKIKTRIVCDTLLVLTPDAMSAA